MQADHLFMRSLEKQFGGHIGVARYAFERYLGFPSELVWQVCDVPAVVHGPSKSVASLRPALAAGMTQALAKARARAALSQAEEGRGIMITWQCTILEDREQA